jgi:hypothetical protein
MTQTPKSVKNGIINTLLLIAHTRCTSNTQLNTEIKKVESILIENIYLKKLISCIKGKREKLDNVKKENITPVATTNLPYVPRLGEKIKRIAAKSNIRTVFISNNTLRSQLVQFKPKSDNLLSKKVEYSIPYECSKQYIGETRRAFDVRLKGHKNSIKKKDPDVSKLCEHHYYTGHRIL